MSTPRLALHDARVELVAAREGSEWVITVDDYASNAPLSGLTVQLQQGTRQVQAAEAADTTYRVSVDVIESALPLRINLRGRDWTAQLEGQLPLIDAAEPLAPPSFATHWIAAAITVFLVLSLFGLWRLLRRPHEARA